MYSNKYIMKIVLYFLPGDAQLMNIGEEYKLPAIVMGDLDRDEEEEVIALYTKDSKNYMIILKRFGKRWHVIWNHKINYKYVTQLGLATLVKNQRQIVLGGKMNEEGRYQLTLLKWKEDELQEMLSEVVEFDKIYVEGIDGIDGLILWKHKVLEVYDIGAYRYKQGRLVLDPSLEKQYFKVVVGYYEYLYQTYKEERIYKEYLEDAKRRCGLEYEIEEQEKCEYLPEKTSIPKAKTVLMEEYEEDKWIGTTGYIQNLECEEDIYLCGRVSEEDGKRFIKNIRLVLTINQKAACRTIAIDQEDVKDCKLFVGDFTKDGIEDIWVGLETTSGKVNVLIYTIDGEKIKKILDSRRLKIETIWEKHKHLIDVRERVQVKLEEIYPVDKRLNEQYEIYCTTTVRTLKDGHILGCIMMCMQWEGDKFMPYAEYFTNY